MVALRSASPLAFGLPESRSQLSGHMWSRVGHGLPGFCRSAKDKKRELVYSPFPIVPSAVGEIVPRRVFYDYRAKYLDKGDEASGLVIPAVIPDPLVLLMQEVAVEVAMLADVRGMARVDFLMNGDTKDIYVNEINTIPGFTEISMYPKLWIASGMTYSGLLDRLIELALEDKLRIEN